MLLEMGSKAVNYGTINLDGKGNFKAEFEFWNRKSEIWCNTKCRI